MFDSLQEGIIVVDKNNIEFMNSLSNKILSFLANLKNFKTNKPLQGQDQSSIHPLDLKLFHLFENADDSSKGNGMSKSSKNKKKKNATSSEYSKPSS